MHGRRLPAVPVPGGLLGAAGLLVVWVASSRFGLVGRSTVPDPASVLRQLLSDLDTVSFWAAIAITATTALAGFVIGVAGGAGTAFALAQPELRWLSELARPYLTFFNSAPRVVLAPFFILILGIGPASRVALSVSLVYFVVFFGVFGAVQAVRPDLVSSARQLGASRLAIWWTVVLPGSLPGFLSAARIAVSLAVLGVVVGEILGSSSGLGGRIRLSGEQFNLPALFSGLIVLGLLSGAASALLSALSNRMLRWR